MWDKVLNPNHLNDITNLLAIRLYPLKLNKKNRLLFLLKEKKQKQLIYLKRTHRPGAVAHAYNPSTLGGQVGWIMRSRDRDHPGQNSKTLSLLKIQKKISWAWWCVPVVPATQEAEAGE